MQGTGDSLVTGTPAMGLEVPQKRQKLQDRGLLLRSWKPLLWAKATVLLYMTLGGPRPSLGLFPHLPEEGGA